MIRVLSEETKVRKIHIISWSADARVLSASIDELAAGHDPSSLRAKYHLGT